MDQAVLKKMGDTWDDLKLVSLKSFQVCTLKNIEGTPVLWTCETQGAQHLIITLKQTKNS